MVWCFCWQRLCGAAGNRDKEGELKALQELWGATFSTAAPWLLPVAKTTQFGQLVVDRGSVGRDVWGHWMEQGTGAPPLPLAPWDASVHTYIQPSCWHWVIPQSILPSGYPNPRQWPVFLTGIPIPKYIFTMETGSLTYLSSQETQLCGTSTPAC